MSVKLLLSVLSLVLWASQAAAQKHLVVEESKGPVKAKGTIQLEPQTIRKLEKLPPGSIIGIKKKGKPEIDQTLKTFYTQSFMRVEGQTDSANHGSLKSSSVPGFGVVWTPWRFDRTQIGFTYSYQTVHFVPAENRQIVNNDEQLRAYMAGASYRLMKDVNIDLYLGLAEQVFFRSLDQNTVKVNTIQVPFTQLGINYNFLKLRRFIASAKVSARLHFPFERDPYEGDGGTGYRGSLALNYGMKTFLASLEGFGGSDTFNFPDNKFKRSEVGISAGIILPIGGSL